MTYIDNEEAVFECFDTAHLHRNTNFLPMTPLTIKIRKCRQTGIPGLWTEDLDAGLWMLGSGRWNLDSPISQAATHEGWLVRCSPRAEGFSHEQSAWYIYVVRNRTLAWKGLTVDEFSYLKWPKTYLNGKLKNEFIDISPLLPKLWTV